MSGGRRLAMLGNIRLKLRLCSSAVSFWSFSGSKVGWAQFNLNTFECPKYNNLSYRGFDL